MLKLYGLSTLDPHKWEDVHNEDATILDAVDSIGGSVGLDGKRKLEIKDPLGLKERLEMFVTLNVGLHIGYYADYLHVMACSSPANMDLQTGEPGLDAGYCHPRADRPNHRQLCAIPSAS